MFLITLHILLRNRVHEQTHFQLRPRASARNKALIAHYCLIIYFISKTVKDFLLIPSVITFLLHILRVRVGLLILHAQYGYNITITPLLLGNHTHRYKI